MNVDITIPAQSVTIPSQDVTATVPAAQIVYQNSWLNQTAAIPQTAIFTPTGEGIFRATAGIFAYGNVAGAGGQLAYSPGPGGAQFGSNGNAVSLLFSSTVGASLLLQASKSDSVTYYDLYVTIEQLQ